MILDSANVCKIPSNVQRWHWHRAPQDHWPAPGFERRAADPDGSRRFFLPDSPRDRWIPQEIFGISPCKPRPRHQCPKWRVGVHFQTPQKAPRKNRNSELDYSTRIRDLLKIRELRLPFQHWLGAIFSPIGYLTGSGLECRAHLRVSGKIPMMMEFRSSTGSSSRSRRQVPILDRAGNSERPLDDPHLKPLKKRNLIEIWQKKIVFFPDLGNYFMASPLGIKKGNYQGVQNKMARTADDFTAFLRMKTRKSTKKSRSKLSFLNIFTALWALNYFFRAQKFKAEKMTCRVEAKKICAAI